MKRSQCYEIAAATIAILGAVLLVSVYFPIINPDQYHIDSHGGTLSVWRFIFGTPFSLAILCASWRVNLRAQALKKGGR